MNLPKIDADVHLRPLGDIHLFNVGCDVKKYLESVNLIAEDEQYYTIGMGDYFDNVMPYAHGMVDKRYNVLTVSKDGLTTNQQVEGFLQTWRPIANKTMGMLAGNHEWKTIDQEEFVSRICKPLGVDYLGRVAFVYVSFKYRGKLVRNYQILALHGGYNSSKSGGAVNRLKEIAADFDADLILMGHNHDCWTKPVTRIGYDPETDDLTERKIMLANTGTFLKTYVKGVDSYPEINPKEARRVGTVTLTFNPYTGGLYGHD